MAAVIIGLASCRSTLALLRGTCLLKLRGICIGVEAVQRKYVADGTMHDSI